MSSASLINKMLMSLHRADVTMKDLEGSDLLQQCKISGVMDVKDAPAEYVPAKGRSKAKEKAAILPKVWSIPEGVTTR